MSITSRINEIETHLKEDYTNLEALGYDIPQDKNIENIASVLDNAWENQSHIEETGTTLSMNTNKGKAKVDLLGNTSQVSYTGVQLFNKNDVGIGRIDNAGNRYIDADYRFCNYLEVEENTSYSANMPFVNQYNRIAFYDTNKTFLSVNQGGGEYTFTTPADTKYIRFGKSATDIDTFMLVKGSTIPTTYEPYVGSTSTNITPAPNPSYPQPIQVVSGNNSVVVCGKNLLDVNNNLISSVQGLSFVANNNGSFSYSGTLESHTWVNFMNDVDTFIKAGEYTISISNSLNFNLVWYFQYEDGTSNTFSVTSGGTSRTVTLQKNVVRHRVGFTFMTIGTTYNGTLKIMLEKGSTATTFEPYTNSSYQVNLGDIELCKIGTYQDKFFKAINGNTIYDNLDSSIKDTLDYGEWYLEKNIGKGVLNGTQSIYSLNTTSTNTARVAYSKIMGDLVGVSTNIICNMLMQKNNWNVDEEGISRDASNDNIWIRINKSTIGTTQNEVNTYLSNHNMIIYTTIAPTYTKIEGTLASQLEDVWRANTYDNQTNVSQVNNDLPFELFFKALGTPSNTLLGLSRQLNEPLNEIEESGDLDGENQKNI